MIENNAEAEEIEVEEGCDLDKRYNKPMAIKDILKDMFPLGEEK